MIGAVVLAAGLSKRMGRPKMTLPWGETTVIGQVAKVLLGAGVDDVQVVTGGARDDVESALSGMPVSTVFNPNFGNGEMMMTLQVGLAALDKEVKAALVVLGDQPQIKIPVVRAVLSAYVQGTHALVVPSFQSRRGHPWLLDRDLWDILFDMNAPMTMRQFLNRHAANIYYVNVNTATVLQDLDTPEDYLRYQSPKNQ